MDTSVVLDPVVHADIDKCKLALTRSDCSLVKHNEYKDDCCSHPVVSSSDYKFLLTVFQHYPYRHQELV